MRVCEMCGDDISHRYFQTRFCTPCTKIRRKRWTKTKRGREIGARGTRKYYASKHGFLKRYKTLSRKMIEEQAQEPIEVIDYETFKGKDRE